jgi:hypothetical protein
MKQTLWINNNEADRTYMLEKTEDNHPGIGQAAIEKDWWVSVTLKALFQTDCANYLIFKGGTSLSKGWNLIERFSEDIDLAISHSFFGINKSNKSQREKLRKLSRAYIQNTLSAQLDERLKAMDITGYRIENVATVENRNGEIVPIDSDKDPTVILLHYGSLLSRKIDYIPPRVKIEISCLSMDEPVEEREIRSLICESFPDDDTDAVCRIKTVVPSRTFLEKIFLLAEEFQKDKPRSMRMSRHLYDLERLMDSDFGKMALADKTLYNAIIDHRQACYALKYVDYSLHHPSTINILPPERVLDDWKQDYSNMQRYFIYGPSLDFELLMKRIIELQSRLRGL